MRRGILKRNTTKRNTRDIRQEAEDNLMQIIEETLRGKSDEEKKEIIKEFIKYFTQEEGLEKEELKKVIEKGLNKYLNKVTRTGPSGPRVRFSNNTRNRNNSNGNKINLNLNNGMTKRRNAKNSVLGNPGTNI
jgi:hypothetical protein